MKIDISLVFPLLCGMALGAFYFYAMWHTISKLTKAEKPERLLIKSALIRLAVILPAFYFVMDKQWERILACLIGFIITRTIAVRYAKLSLENIFNSKSASKMEQNHAS